MLLDEKNLALLYEIKKLYNEKRYKRLIKELVRILQKENRVDKTKTQEVIFNKLSNLLNILKPPQDEHTAILLEISYLRQKQFKVREQMAELEQLYWINGSSLEQAKLNQYYELSSQTMSIDLRINQLYDKMTSRSRE
jgi:hypothetical protein